MSEKKTKQNHLNLQNIMSTKNKTKQTNKKFKPK